MQRLTLWLVIVLLSLAIVTGVVWLVCSYSQSARQKENQSSTVSMSGVPTVVFCDLLANPTAYDMKVIRVQAVLVVNQDYRALYDP